MNIVNIISFLCGLFGVFAFFFDHSDLKITLGWKALCIVILVIFIVIGVVFGQNRRYCIWQVGLFNWMTFSLF